MFTLPQLTEFLGWASVLNIIYLLLATLLMARMKDKISAIHSKIFKLDEQVLSSKYFDFLSRYKTITLVVFIAPYLALKIMGY